MTKNATITTDTTTHERVIKFTGGGRIPAGHPYGQYELQAEQVTIKWHGNEPAPFLWVQGPRVLKSGELGKWVGVAVAEPGQPIGYHQACPEWLAALVKRYDYV